MISGVQYIENRLKITNGYLIDKYIEDGQWTNYQIESFDSYLTVVENGIKINEFINFIRRYLFQKSAITDYTRGNRCNT